MVGLYSFYPAYIPVVDVKLILHVFVDAITGCVWSCRKRYAVLGRSKNYELFQQVSRPVLSTYAYLYVRTFHKIA